MQDRADQRPDPLEALVALGDLRVWSVIITIFGDAVRQRGGSIAAGTLGHLTQPLGIRPEALRVALHRLVRDGWLEREKHGRNSHYRLSPGGQREFDPATRRIYAPAPMTKPPWRLAALDDGDGTPPPPGWTELRPGLFLGHGGAAGLAGRPLVLSGDVTDLPDWARAALGPPEIAKGYRDLASLLQDIAPDLPGRDPVRAAATRLLIVHHWRRLLLNHADLPERFFPDGWQGETCRARVHALHRRLSALADPWLDQEVAPPLVAK